MTDCCGGAGFPSSSWPALTAQLGVRRGGTWRISTPQVMTTAVEATLVWNVEDADTDTMLTVPGTTITIPATGLWAVCASITFATVSTTNMARIVLSTGQSFISDTDPVYGFANPTYIGPLAAASTVQMLAKQSTGGNVNLTGSIQVYRLGP